MLFRSLAWKAPVPAEKLVWPLIGALLVMTVLGAPLFVTVGGAALIFFWGEDVTVSSVSINQYKLVTDAVLPTLPLFTLAGYFLAESGASKRLLAVFEAVVGQFRGGPAIVTCLVCAFFTTFTGASGVTILALGGLLMPVLIAEKYSERNALGLVTAAGSLGPDLTGAAKRFSVEDLFAAIVFPSRDIAPPYRPENFLLKDGSSVNGLVVFVSADGWIVQTGASTTVDRKSTL